MESPTRDQVEGIIKARWSIEVYHRELKQTRGIQRCQARTGRSRRNHICLAVMAWLNKYKPWLRHKLTWYQQNWNVIKLAIRKAVAGMLACSKT